MNVIRSHLHDVYTEEVNKVALSAEDDKRVCDAGRTATDMNESIIIAAKIV